MANSKAWEWFKRYIWTPLGHFFRARSVLDLLGFKAAWSGFWKALAVMFAVFGVAMLAAVRAYPWPFIAVLVLCLYLALVHLLRIPAQRSTLQVEGVYAGEWSFSEFDKPFAVSVRQLKATGTAKNTTARVRFSHADGTQFTVTQAPWIVRVFQGTQETSSATRKSVDLQGDERQAFVLLMRRSDNRSLWAYEGMPGAPVGLLHAGYWKAQCDLASDTTGPLTWTVGFNVYRDNSIRWDDPKTAPPSPPSAS